MSPQEELQEPGALLAGLSDDEHRGFPAREPDRYGGHGGDLLLSSTSTPSSWGTGCWHGAGHRHHPMLSSPGKYSSDISPAFLLNVPYVLIPIWAGVKLFQQPRALPCLTAEQVSQKGAGTRGAATLGSGAQPVGFFLPLPRLQRSSASGSTSGPRTWCWSCSCSWWPPSPSSGAW